MKLMQITYLKTNKVKKQSAQLRKDMDKFKSDFDKLRQKSMEIQNEVDSLGDILDKSKENFRVLHDKNLSSDYPLLFIELTP